MTGWGLVRRSLVHHWRGHVAAACGVAIAGSVLVGSLVVGDSVNASLQALVGERLGAVEFAVLAPGRGVRSALAATLADALGPDTVVAPVLRLPGVLSLPEGDGRVADVQLLGVTEAYWRALGLEPPRDARAVLVPNHRLATRLGAKAGDQLVVRVGQSGGPAPDAPMALSPPGVRAGTLPIGAIVDGPATGFDLAVHGPATATALVPLTWLQGVAGLAGRANVLLVRGASRQGVEAALARSWQLADMGLSVAEVDDGFALRSTGIVLADAVVEAAAAGSARRTLTWFADTLRARDRETPYSFVAATDPPPVEGLGDDEIAVNAWLAEDLGVGVGDTVAMTYPTFGPRRTRGEGHRTFTVRAVLPMTGLGADRELSVIFPGFEEARSCREWEPGVAIDLDRLRDADEAYWTRYRGAPKAFVTRAAGEAMWRNPFGPLTSIRADAERAAQWRLDLPRVVPPDAVGVHVVPVAERAMAAAVPTTDFGGLFLGLGGLLIIAALLLTTLLLRLGVTRRADEAATLSALGLRRRQIRALRLKEGALGITLGTLVGLAGGVVVAEATLSALGSVWQGAIGGLSLVFHANWLSLLGGAVATWLCGFGALIRAGRDTDQITGARPGRRPALICVGALICAGVLLVMSGDHPAGAFFGAGGLTLVAGLAAMTAALRARVTRPADTVWRMAWANLSRRHGAAVTATAVLACGTFVVVGVGVSRQDASTMTARTSGTGGFALVATSALGVPQGLDTDAGLAAHGLTRADLKGASVVPFRVRDGDDASCLNLAQAARPRLLGVRPAAMVSRGAFSREAWSRLAADPGDPDVVLAVGDEATLTWRLKLGVGDELADVDEAGRPYRLRIVGVLPSSVLQGALIVDVAALARRFPSVSSDRFFLIDAAPEIAAEVGAVLSDALGDRGFEVTPTEEVLGVFLRVENTYLAIFLALGGLGLLLGAPGVGVLLFRQVLTRRRELAVLVAMGWRRHRVRRLVALEHGAIVALGVAIGGLSAALAVVPALGSSVSRAPAQAAVGIVGAVLLVGLVATSVATRVALRGRLVDALSDDR